MADDIYDLRSALDFLKNHGEEAVLHDQPISSEYDIANHYVHHSAGVPASSVSREEKMVMYRNVDGHDMPVLMGMFGSRKRNQLLLTGQSECHHGAFMQAMHRRIKPVKIENPVCQEVVIDKDIDLMKSLPILTLTKDDAGPYITLGFVLAKDPDTGAFNASINRLCIQGKSEMTISIYPGRHLGALYEAALSKGQSLPISINIGLDPAVYYASCLTEPVCNKGESELDIVGGLRGKAVKLSDCITVNTECLSDAEIVIEAEITPEKIAENYANKASGSMPEFLGYQGIVVPESEVPVVKVKAITHRKNPIYQTLIGPGLEQSELQAITPEVATRGFLKQHFNLDFKEIVYNTAGGGLLMAIIQINKQDESDDALAVKAALQVLSLVPPLKHIFLVDEDVNPYSSEDLLWALTTRYQADQDMHMLSNKKPFLMDPSQTPAYRRNVENKNESVKALFDCTGPWAMKARFKRPFVQQ